MTGDLDLATAQLALTASPPERMEAVLRRADPTFEAIPQPDPRKPPSRFRNDEGYRRPADAGPPKDGPEPHAPESPRSRRRSTPISGLAHSRSGSDGGAVGRWHRALGSSARPFCDSQAHSRPTARSRQPPQENQGSQSGQSIDPGARFPVSRSSRRRDGSSTRAKPRSAPRRRSRSGPPCSRQVRKRSS